ncbi:MAG: hypothetical protein Q8913_03290 [Bacteroidota bacterium]|nr:hypothetical protein [Bacteroidota bacterium]
MEFIYLLKAMSTTVFSSSTSVNTHVGLGAGRGTRRRNRGTLRTSATRVSGLGNPLESFVDLQSSPFARSANPAGDASNPVADLIPDELFEMLRTHDLISEMGIRNYVIRKVYHELREVQALSTAQAMEKIQEAYPYLQLDTIRKIIYRIGPPANRKLAY